MTDIEDVPAVHPKPRVRGAARAITILVVTLGLVTGAYAGSALLDAHRVQTTLVDGLELPEGLFDADEVWDRARTETRWAYDLLSTSEDTKTLIDLAAARAMDQHREACETVDARVWLPTLRGDVERACGPTDAAARLADARGLALAAITQAAHTICRQAPHFKHTLAGVLALTMATPGEIDEAYNQLAPAAHGLERALRSAYAQTSDASVSDASLCVRE